MSCKSTDVDAVSTLSIDVVVTVVFGLSILFVLSYALSLLKKLSDTIRFPEFAIRSIDRRCMKKAYTSHDFVKVVLNTFYEYDPYYNKNWLVKLIGMEISAFVQAKVGL